MGPVASSQWINPLCCSFLCTLFPCSHVVAPWSAGHYLLWCLQQTPWMTLRFSESFLTCFFRSGFSFSLTFLPFLKNISPRNHIYDCESQLHAMSGGFGANWIPLCQHGIAPASSLRGQSCCSSLSTPGHSHPMQSPTCQILLSPAGSTTLCRVWTPLLYSVCYTASPFKLTVMSDQTSARKKIVETAQGSKATDWMVQEHCYFPYFTTTSFSVLRVWIV